MGNPAHSDPGHSTGETRAHGLKVLAAQRAGFTSPSGGLRAVLGRLAVPACARPLDPALLAIPRETQGADCASLARHALFQRTWSWGNGAGAGRGWPFTLQSVPHETPTCLPLDERKETKEGKKREEKPIGEHVLMGSSSCYLASAVSLSNCSESSSALASAPRGGGQ